MSAYDEFKGKVRLILAGGKRVQVSRSHSVCELENGIEGLKIGDIIVCNSFRTIRKFDDKQKKLGGYMASVSVPNEMKQKLELMDKLTSKSKATDKDVKELSKKIKANVAKWHNQKS